MAVDASLHSLERDEGDATASRLALLPAGHTGVILIKGVAARSIVLTALNVADRVPGDPQSWNIQTGDNCWRIAMVQACICQEQPRHELFGHLLDAQEKSKGLRKHNQVVAEADNLADYRGLSDLNPFVNSTTFLSMLLFDGRILVQ